MKKITLITTVITLSASLIGCGEQPKPIKRTSYEQYEREQEELRLRKENAERSAVVAKAKLVFAENFIDPSSVKIKGLKINYTHTAACAYINAKNAFGAYTGYKPYTVTLYAPYQLYDNEWVCN